MTKPTRPGASRPETMRIALTSGILATAVLLAGCVDRRIRVTSEPSGARVWVNDVDLGRTPAETSFTFYGHYELRLQLDGYEPVTETRQARAPIYEQPGLDLIAEALPVEFENTIEWHIDLEPALGAVAASEEARVQLERDLVRRAEEAAAALDAPARD